MQKAFYKDLQNYYSSRKYKELITLGCADRCFGQVEGTIREDDLTMAEHGCVTRCLGKYFRYLNYANTLYTYLLTGDGSEESEEEAKARASAAIAASQASGAPL